MLIKDKKEIEDYLHPENIIDLFVRWNYLDKTDKQKLISKYIDDMEIEKLGTKIEIKKLNLRNSFYYDLIDYHNNYDTPLDLFMFMDEDKFPIPVAHNGFRTRIEIGNYVNKLKEMYDVNYYEVKPNKDFTNLSFTPKNDIEKIIRIIIILKLKINFTYLKYLFKLINLNSFLDIFNVFLKKYITIIGI